MRIVSLISSGTEILHALGLGDLLVGISHECDFPPSILGLPVLSEPKIDPRRPSATIDRDVRRLVSEGLSVYRILTDRLAALQPDLIITQDQCEVCAVSLKDVEEAVCAVTLKATKIVSLKPHTLADIENDFRKVGDATGHPDRAEKLVQSFRERLAKVAATVGPATHLPRVACVEWVDPLIIAGGWIPEIARIAGAVPVIVGGPERFRQICWEDLRSANPDAVTIFPCGYDVPRTLEELKVPSVLQGMLQIPAVRDGGAYVCDGNAFFNRAGPRIADSCEILAAILHPELAGHYRKLHAKAFTSWMLA